MLHSRNLLAGLLRCAFTGFLAWSVASNVMAASRVATRAQADNAYLEARLARTGSRVETYVFYAGKFFPGHIPDRTLERTPFDQIAQTLAPHLARQAYFPAKSLESADLILVVHWGVTMGYDRSAALFNYSLDSQTRVQETRLSLEAQLPTGASDDDPVDYNALAAAMAQTNDAISAVGAHDATSLHQLGRDLSVTSNAGLLGFSDLLHEASQSAVVTTSLTSMEGMLDEDRYFVVVMAYDRRSLVERKVLQRRWSVRLSIRAPGRNFRSALAVLGVAGGEVFGLNTPSLVVKKPKTPQTHVEIGDVVVVGSDDRTRSER